MKTAMQELIDWMEENHFKVTLGFLDQIEYCKQKEKEQIIDAHWAGWGHAYDYYVTEADSYDSQAIQAEDYYNETYNQNK